MDLLASYGDDGEAASPPREQDDVDADLPGPSGTVPGLQLQITAAPEVTTAGIVLHDGKVADTGAARHLQDPSVRKVMYNLPVDTLHAPVLGPAHPFNRDGLAAGQRNHRSGHVEDLYMHPYHFDAQYNNFQALGYGAAPGTATVVGDAAAFQQHGGAEVFTGSAKRRKTSAEKREEQAAKAARRAQEGQDLDPDAPFTLSQRQPWANKEVAVSELTDEQKAYLAAAEQAKMEAAGDQVETKGPVSFFHGKEDKDYQGRSWLAEPKDKRRENEVCFAPKRWIHTWPGHAKGVSAIRFFPGTGHMLLSAGLDGKVKIWDVYGNQKCMRTYIGHSKGVRDITFSNDGRRFVSTGYDKNVRVWDTETGKVIQTFNTGKMYYCVTLHPEKQNTLMAGANDKKIYQWDIDTGDLVQEYNYHLGAVNTITFLDPPGGTRFVTTSDDKTIRMWEFGIPVQIKYLADPSMHAISTAAMNPAHTMWIGQSQDNQIVSYSCARGEKFKLQKHKAFKGHNTAGYACGVNFSPDGKYVMSGDSEGRAFFWEWSHPNKVVRTIKAHDAVCVGVEWHPLETSKVATCGWDGVIKYWD